MHRHWQILGHFFRGSNFKPQMTADDVAEWTQNAFSLEYLNLGNLTLKNLSFKSFALNTLLLLNVDIFSEFEMDCPRLEQLWIGTNRKKTIRTSKTGSKDIHGESMTRVVFLCSSIAEIAVGRKRLQVYLPEEFGVSFGGATQLQYNVDTFWETGTRPSTFNGPVFYSKWKESEAEQACRETKELLVSALRHLDPNMFDIVVTKGSTPGILCSPYLQPKAPDAKWHKDYSQVGLGHDGGYSYQCESNWY